LSVAIPAAIRYYSITEISGFDPPGLEINLNAYRSRPLMFTWLLHHEHSHHLIHSPDSGSADADLPDSLHI